MVYQVHESTGTIGLEGESKITPVLQMSQPELQNLAKDCENKIKSIVFKQVKKVCDLIFGTFSNSSTPDAVGTLCFN